MPNIFDLPHFAATPSPDDPQMPKDGDTVIVLRPDGSVDMFSLGNHGAQAARKLKLGQPLTVEEKSHVHTATKAFALYFAARNEAVMETLLEFVGNSPVVDPKALDSLPKIS